MRMNKIYGKPKSILENAANPYCPGCLHGVAHKIVAEVLDEMNMREQTIAVLPVGCACLGIFYWNVDNVNSSHGRAPAVATGIKRCSPENIVFTYQGDGDLASIGLSEIMHSANRGENFTVIFINNGIFGMTGGQMSPMTLVGQKASTSPFGRNPKTEGYPMKMCEILSQLTAPAYIARHALNNPKNILQAKKSIAKAFKIQLEGKGFTFIELLSNCPTNWGLSAVDSISWMEEKTMKEFPLGVFRDKEE